MDARTASRRIALAAAILLGVAGAVYAAARVDRTSGEAWYDPRPLLASLRPEARPGLVAALAVDKLEDLPLYDLDLVYDPASASFTLGEDVWFTNTTDAPLVDVVFRVYANAAPPESGPQVHLVSGGCAPPARCSAAEASPSAIRVVPAAPVPSGGRLHVKLQLRGALTRIAAERTTFLAQGLEGMQSVLGSGGGGGDYGLLALGDGIASFANFYAVLARHAGAAWETDESSKLGDLDSDAMANFRARLELPGRARLAVAGVVTHEQPLSPYPDGAPRREVNVVAGAIRDFALLFGDGLEVSTRDVHGVAVRSYFLAADRPAGERVLDVAAHALEDFERRFGAYPYADYDVCEAAIVGGAGGVEFSGIVTAASMFYRPATAAPAHGQGGGSDALSAILGQLGGMGALGGAGTETMLEFVVAHETAHQWWHGMVGSDSREHPYVDEALAQYSSIVYLEDRYGHARADKDGASNVKMNYQTMRMLGKPDAPADMPVASYVASVQYAGIIYGKAPYFYAAVRKAMGDGPFFAALRAYVAKYRFGVAPARGVVDLLAAGHESKVRPLERRWLDERHGDEDIGTLDLNAMLGGALGGAGGSGGLGGLGGAGGLGDLDQMMKMLEAAGVTLPGAPPSGAVPPGSGPTPLQGVPGGGDMNEILKALGGN